MQWARTASAVRAGSLATTKGLRRFAGGPVRHADHRRLLDAGELGQHVLDLVGIDVEAGDQDHVLRAVDEPEEAGLVLDGDVAGEVASRRA